MPSIRINKALNSQTYFITFTVRNWYYVFDRHSRWNILSNSLQYCQKEKGLQIYAFVFMLNHIHILASSPDMSGFVCDFKKFTSKQMEQNILQTEPGILTLFTEDNVYNFWGKTNMPKLVETEGYFNQKLNYIHNNPVKKNYVTMPEHWYWSSANKLCEIKVDAF